MQSANSQTKRTPSLRSAGKCVAPGWMSVVALLLFVPWTAHAQSPTPPPAQNPPPASGQSNAGVYGRDIFVPKEVEKKEPESGATSFADGFLRNTRQHIGASVGVSETYSPNVSTSGNRPRYISRPFSLRSSLISEKKAIDFRLNYGVAYERLKEGTAELNTRRKMELPH